MKLIPKTNGQVLNEIYGDAEARNKQTITYLNMMKEANEKDRPLIEAELNMMRHAEQMTMDMKQSDAALKLLIIISLGFSFAFICFITALIFLVSVGVFNINDGGWQTFLALVGAVGMFVGGLITALAKRIGVDIPNGMKDAKNSLTGK